MKQNLKRYLKLGIFFSLINCQKDDDFAKPAETKIVTPKAKYAAVKIFKEEIISNTNLVKTLTNIKDKTQPKTNATTGKIIFNADLNIEINDDYAIYLESANGLYHSYTFAAKDYNEPDVKKNLILSLQEDGTYLELLMAYNLTPEELDNYNETGQVDLENKFSYHILENGSFSTSIFSKKAAIPSGCLDIEYGDLNGTKCTGRHKHPWTLRSSCPLYPGPNGPTSGMDIIGIDVDLDCIGGGTPIGGPSGNTPIGNTPIDGTSGGGTAGDGTENPDYDPTDGSIHGLGTVVYAPALEEDNVPSNHEEKLKALTENQKIKDKITELKTLTNMQREYGYSFKLSGGNPIDYNITPAILAPDSKGVNFVPPSILTRLEMHTHFIGLDNAFSFEDLFNTVRSATNANNEQHTSILVAPNGKLYALRVNNLQEAGQFANNYTNSNGEADEDRFEKMAFYYNEYVIKPANRDCAGICTDPEYDALLNNYLANILNTFGTGLSLYEATVDTNGNIIWTQIIYTP